MTRTAPRKVRFGILFVALMMIGTACSIEAPDVILSGGRTPAACRALPARPCRRALCRERCRARSRIAAGGAARCRAERSRHVVRRQGDDHRCHGYFDQGRRNVRRLRSGLQHLRPDPQGRAGVLQRDEREGRHQRPQDQPRVGRRRLGRSEGQGAHQEARRAGQGVPPDGRPFFERARRVALLPRAEGRAGLRNLRPDREPVPQRHAVAGRNQHAQRLADRAARHEGAQRHQRRDHLAGSAGRERSA